MKRWAFLLTFAVWIFFSAGCDEVTGDGNSDLTVFRDTTDSNSGNLASDSFADSDSIADSTSLTDSNSSTDSNSIADSETVSAGVGDSDVDTGSTDVSHRDSDTLEAVYLSEARNRLKAVWVTASGNVYIGGDQSRLITWDGTKWQSGELGSHNTIYDFQGIDDDHIYAAAGSTDLADGRPDWPAGETEGRIFEFVNGEWTLAHAEVLEPAYRNWANLNDWGYLDLWSLDASNIYAVHDQGVVRFDGEKWENWVEKDWLSAVHGIDENNLCVASVAYAQLDVDVHPGIECFDGTQWRDSPFLGGCDLKYHDGLYAIWSGASNDETMWFAGDGGICGWHGDYVDDSYDVEGALWDVWGTGADNVYAVGDGGVIIHYDGEEWTSSTIVSPTTEALYAVHGNQADNVYAVGDNGTVVHYDGETWQLVEIR